jgi:AraC-like DNA-binding protein
LTEGNFHRLSFTEAGPCEIAKLLEALEPSISFFMDRHEDERMAFDFSLRIMPNAYASFQTMSGMSNMRQKNHVALDGNDDLCLLVHRGGHPIQMRLHDRRHGRDEVTVGPGGPAHLRGNDERYSAWSLTSHSQVICVSRAHIAAAVGDLDHALDHGVPQSAALDLLCGYARTLASDIGPLDGEVLLQARKTLTDLFILAVDPTRDAIEATKDSARAARLARIKDDIWANLSHPDLSLEWIAARHGFSPRAIRNLFYASSANFTDYVLAARLERAHELLCDPRLNHHSITAIAYQSGFGDLSWFNQAFRRRYKMTPSDVRRSRPVAPPT